MGRGPFEAPVAAGCQRSRETLDCFLSLHAACQPNADGVSVDESLWLRSDGGADWRGELTAAMQRNGRPLCSSRYVVILEPR